MDISASQYNSASESGWTHYLDQSSFSEKYFQKRDEIADHEGKGTRILMEEESQEEEQEEEEEEDLSMVSDASSGPPQPHYDNEFYYENWYSYLSSTSSSKYTKESQKKNKKFKEFGRSQQPSSPLLDDTASSSLYNCPKQILKNGAVENAVDFSLCLSATRIKRNSQFHKHFRGKQASQEPGCFNDEQRK